MSLCYAAESELNEAQETEEPTKNLSSTKPCLHLCYFQIYVLTGAKLQVAVPYLS